MVYSAGCCKPSCYAGSSPTQVGSAPVLPSQEPFFKCIHSALGKLLAALLFCGASGTWSQDKLQLSLPSSANFTVLKQNFHTIKSGDVTQGPRGSRYVGQKGPFVLCCFLDCTTHQVIKF